MFDNAQAPARMDPLPSLAEGPLRADAVARWRDALAGMDRRVDDAERIEQIRALEELKSAAAAAQARAAADLHASVSAAQEASGLPVEERGRGVAAQVAFARRESPFRGGQYLGMSRALVGEMPRTMAALTAGRLSEWRATLLVRETACLSAEHRRQVDAEVCPDVHVLEALGDRALVAAAQRVAYRLDPQSFVDRARRAESDRRVTVRPAPDTMAYLTGLLPVAQAVAAYAALARAADAARAAGDPRTRGQLMADLAVERLTGQAQADDVPLQVNVVMTDRALLEGDDEPAHVPGYGPVPAQWARDLVRPRTSLDKRAAVWLRRMYTHPRTGELVAIDSRARLFPDALRDFLVLRDQTCRTPWCDAPVRHADHVVSRAQDGATSAANGQGLCEACNYTKETPGWWSRPAPDSAPGRHAVETITPTGHRYVSRPPPQPGVPGNPALSRIELLFAEYLHAA